MKIHAAITQAINRNMTITGRRFTVQPLYQDQANAFEQA
jgi:hypothetical protein